MKYRSWKICAICKSDALGDTHIARSCILSGTKNTRACSSHGYPDARGYPCTENIINNFGESVQWLGPPCPFFRSFRPRQSAISNNTLRSAPRCLSIHLGEVLCVTYAHSRGTWGWKLDNPPRDAQLLGSPFRNWFSRHVDRS